MSGFLCRIVTLISQFAIKTVFISKLGADLLGINGLFTNILLVLSLADLGLNTVMSYSYYKPIANKDEDKLSALTNYYKKVYNYIALIVAVIGIAFLPFLKFIVHTETAVEHLNVIYLLYIFDTVVSYLFVYKTTILTADQRATVSNIYGTVVQIIKATVQIFILFFWGNFILYLVSGSAISLLNNLFQARKVEHYYPYVNNRSCKLNLDEKREITQNIKSGVIYKISGVLLNGTDNILISAIVGTIWVGLLSNYLTIITALKSLLVMIFGSLTASIGNMVQVEDKEKKEAIFNTMLFISQWISSILVVGLYIMIDDVIFTWIGKDFLLSRNIVIVNIIMAYCSCVLQPVYSFREAMGLYRKTKYVMFMTAILNIVISILLGVYMGVFGILLASLIAMFLTYIWYEPIILYRECFQKSSKPYWISNIKNIIITLAIAFLANACLKNYICHNWFDIILKSIIVFFLANVLYFLFHIKSPYYQSILNRVKYLWRKI